MDRANSFIGASSATAEAKPDDFEAQQLDREKLDGVVVIVDPVLIALKQLCSRNLVLYSVQLHPVNEITSLCSFISYC